MSQRTSRTARAYIRAAYHKNHLAFTALVLLSLMSCVLQSLVAVALQLVIDTASGVGIYTIGQLVFVAGIFLLLSFVLDMATRACSTRFYRRAAIQYRTVLFEKLMRKNISAFSAEQTGTYISMLTADASAVDEKYFRSTVKILMNVTEIALGLALMFWYSWRLALIAIALSSVPILVSAAFGGVMTRRQRCVSEQSARFVSTVKDLLSGFPVIKSFQAEEQTQNLYRGQCGDLEQAKYCSSRTEQLIDAISGCAAFVMQFGVFLIGAYFVAKGYLTTGVIVAFVQLTGTVVYPLRVLPTMLSERKAAKGLVETADRLLRSNTRAEGGKTEAVLGEGIECRDLRFGYAPESEVLKGLNARFESGKSYAVVGASGSGKSTLLNLLLGAYDDYAGSITVGGSELREIRLGSLYELVSIISQNVFVFDATIEDNITMFKPFPEEAIQDAVRRSGLTRLLAEKGRAYRCGENGCNLSGGERQRISIARCLLKDTQVLLMDEATAALDAQTAANVTNAILDVEGLLRIVVTHKLEETTLRRFDEILVMRGGVIAERGRFDALLEKKGYFYALYNVSREEA